MEKGNYAESIYNAGKTIFSAGFDTAAATLKDSVNMLNPTKIEHDAFSARMNITCLKA